MKEQTHYMTDLLLFMQVCLFVGYFSK